jgi:hypothetical protein
MHASWSKSKPPGADADVVLVETEEGGWAAVPILKTAKGWWVADETPEIPAGVEGGMESVCSYSFARATVTPSKWKGQAGFYFRIFEKHACFPKWSTSPPVGPPSTFAAKDIACVDDPSGPPRCVMADAVSANVADSFTEATLP